MDGLAAGHSLERSRRVHFVVYAGILVGGDSWRHNCGFFLLHLLRCVSGAFP